MIIIGGATATGKSALAAKLAERMDGELVSADSMQIYVGMDIGTAKDMNPAFAEHLIDVASPLSPFTVVDYKERAAQAIGDISARGKTPIVVGGTGLYIDSLLYDMEYGGGGSINEDLKKSLKEELDKYGAEYMHAKLAKLDAVTAEKVHYNNTVRVLRALYVVLDTGKPISSQNAELRPIEPFKLFVLTEDRAVLREKIAARVEKMLESGLEKEVAALLDSGADFSMQSMQAIGYKEWSEYFAGRASLSDVKERIIVNTRAYAKRQETWFNNRYKQFAVQIRASDLKNNPDKVLTLVDSTSYVGR